MFSFSAIDITLCDLLSYMDYKWKVFKDLCDSNHFSYIHSPQPFYDDKLLYLKVNKAKREEIKTICHQKLTQDPNNKYITKNFIKSLIILAKETISKKPHPQIDTIHPGLMLTGKQQSACKKLSKTNLIKNPPPSI